MGPGTRRVSASFESAALSRLRTLSVLGLVLPSIPVRLDADFALVGALAGLGDERHLLSLILSDIC
jgi:hypothetical protein